MVTNQLNMETQSLNVAIVECNDLRMHLLLKRMKTSSRKYGTVISFQDLNALLAFENCLNKYIIILNINTPNDDNISGIVRIKSNWPNCYILVMSDLHDSSYVLKIVTAGAAGYISADDEPAKVEEALREIYVGGSPVTPMVARQLVQYFQVCKSKINELTQRELEVTKCLVAGMSYKLIAAELNISIDTVRKHITNIYHKLKINSKEGLFAQYRDVVNY